MIVNLLRETEDVMAENGEEMKYVRFISNAEGLIDVAQFTLVAQHYEYNNQASTCQVDPTIKIVGSNWWMSRMVVSGTERWMFHRRPQRPTIKVGDFTVNTTRPPSQTDTLG